MSFSLSMGFSHEHKICLSNIFHDILKFTSQFYSIVFNFVLVYFREFFLTFRKLQLCVGHHKDTTPYNDIGVSRVMYVPLECGDCGGKYFYLAANLRISLLFFTYTLLFFTLTPQMKIICHLWGCCV